MLARVYLQHEAEDGKEHVGFVADGQLQCFAVSTPKAGTIPSESVPARRHKRAEEGMLMCR